MPSATYGETWTHLNAQTQEDLYPPSFSAMTPLAQLALGARGGHSLAP